MLHKLKLQLSSIILELGAIIALTAWLKFNVQSVSGFMFIPFYLVPLRRLISLDDVSSKFKYAASLCFFILGFYLYFYEAPPTELKNTVEHQKANELKHQKEKSMATGLPQQELRQEDTIEDTKTHRPRKNLAPPRSMSAAQHKASTMSNDGPEEDTLQEDYEQDKNVEAESAKNILPDDKMTYAEFSKVIPLPPPVIKNPEEMKRRDAVRSFYQKNKPIR